MKANNNFLIIFSFLLLQIYSTNYQLSFDYEQNEDKLLFVWKHFRHGARGPYIGIDKKTHLDFIGEPWDTVGELTPLGLRMHYLLGIATKNEYSNFISEQYNPNELYISSTNVNRTMLSVYSFLKGFYDSHTTEDLTEKQIERGRILNSNYSDEIEEKISQMGSKSLEGGFSEIPVHIIDGKKLEFGLYEGSNCPGIKKYEKENQESERVKKIYEDIMKYTNKTFGENILKFMNTTDLNFLWNKTNIYYISDTFFSDYFNGRIMKYIKDTGINMDEFYNNSFNVTFIDTYHYTFGIPSTDTVYISVSPMFRSIFNYMDLRIKLDKNSTPDEIIAEAPRFVILSGHDTSLAPIDIFMESEFGIDFGMATYASSQTFELWKNGTTGKYSIHYLFNQKLKGIFDFDEFKIKVNNKTYAHEQIKNICFPNETESLSFIETINIYSNSFNQKNVLIFISISSIIFILIARIFYQKNKARKNLVNNINMINEYLV